MSLTWTAENLELHTAKHFLGTPEEGWRELLPTEAREAWSSWREAAESARCRFAEHPRRCSEVESCGPVQREAAVPYRELADADWGFAEQRDFLVRYLDGDGDPCLCGTGPRGIFVVVAQKRSGERVAKTAFRPSRSRPVRGAVRKMRAYASLEAGAWSVMDLVHLETRLLGAPTPIAPAIERLAADLLTGGARP